MKLISPTSIYQIKVTLKDSKPPIWRRFEINGDVNLATLHTVLQVVMGWENYHLHQFRIGETEYGIPDLEWGYEVADASTTRLQDVAPKGTKFEYIYDFGDYWQHTIQVEKVTPEQKRLTRANCITGKRACPPEDCGGVWGYESLLDTLQNPDEPEYQEMRDWVDEDFDPTRFDLEAVNLQLQKIILR